MQSRALARVPQNSESLDRPALGPVYPFNDSIKEKQPMSTWQELERRFTERLNLTRRPVGVTFLDDEPSDIEKLSGTEPAGCGFWRRAAEGDSFYTVPADHYNCPIGSYTHNISLPAERSHELTDMLNLMFSSGYLRAEEVPGIFKLEKAPGAIAYAPLADSRRSPSVVLFVCRPNTAMLLNEAATRAGAGASLPCGRRLCMAGSFAWPTV